MKSYVFDIETDDIKATRIWCISLLDIDTEEQLTYGPSEIHEGLQMLKLADKLIGHNILGFDIPVIKKLTGVDLYNKTIVDTLVLSRLFNPVRELGHSLEAWGLKLKLPKIEFEEYSEFSMKMLEYCERDVAVNFKVYNHLKKVEAKGFSKRSSELEHSVAKLVNDQREHGFLFNLEHGSTLLVKLDVEIDKLSEEIQKDFIAKKEILKLSPKFNSKGTLLKTGATKEGRGIRLTDIEFQEMQEKGEVTRINIEEFNPGSRKQIGEHLKNLGWKPLEFTPTGQPKVDETILSKITNIPQAQLLSSYLTIQKRIAQLRNWLEELKKYPDDRVRGYVNHNGTITGRMTHNSPNMAQVPSTSSEYGSEFRACWTVPSNYKLVGIDASGLELRMLAHYMNDEGYTHEIINGDIHTANQKLAGLESRDQAKTFIYALIYGAGDEKLGAVAKGSRKVGTKLRESFIANLPSYKNLKNRIAREAATGKIKGLDGRILLIRNQHSALNTLLQGAGSIVMKKALVIFTDLISNLNANVVANVHDEWQVEVHEDDAEAVGNCGVQAIQTAGIQLNLNCPLDGEFKIGNNWSETH